jgi:hypothetical protein
LALLAGLALAPAAVPAETSILESLHEDQPVSVYVGFSIQVPLPDLREATLAAVRKAWHEHLYRLSRNECALLEATIAKTCRLIDISISADIVRRNDAQPLFYISGNASFTIGLKDDEAGGG